MAVARRGAHAGPLLRLHERPLLSGQARGPRLARVWREQGSHAAAHPRRARGAARARGGRGRRRTGHARRRLRRVEPGSGDSCARGEAGPASARRRVALSRRTRPGQLAQHALCALAPAGRQSHGVGRERLGHAHARRLAPRPATKAGARRGRLPDRSQHRGGCARAGWRDARARRAGRCGRVRRPGPRLPPRRLRLHALRPRPRRRSRPPPRPARLPRERVRAGRSADPPPLCCGGAHPAPPHRRAVLRGAAHGGAYCEGGRGSARAARRPRRHRRGAGRAGDRGAFRHAAGPGRPVRRALGRLQGRRRGVRRGRARGGRGGRGCPHAVDVRPLLRQGPRRAARGARRDGRARGALAAVADKVARAAARRARRVGSPRRHALFGPPLGRRGGGAVGAPARLHPCRRSRARRVPAPHDARRDEPHYALERVCVSRALRGGARKRGTS
mmetsp:Transcript_35543/g.114265  ORF Transcript_35543/g.114265 Transcript_35543/m.114265 type:complete len:447 (-) Transcript_35543:762-2102(-)